MSKKFLGLQSYCIITGASQGIGAKIAVELSRKFADGSLLVLLARSIDGLNKTKQMVSETNPQVTVLTYSIDLSKPNTDDLTSIIKKSFKDSGKEGSSFSIGMLVHNAGSLGDIKEYCADMSNPQKMHEYFSLNLFSVMCLTSVFLKIFNQEIVKQRLIVNITSLCAIKPMKSMGYYCIGKASREMYFKVLAEEDSSLSVLSYSPGPVNTDMISDIMTNVRDQEIKGMFLSMKESESILSVDQTVCRFIGILDKGEFQSGCRIDYFDAEN